MRRTLTCLAGAAALATTLSACGSSDAGAKSGGCASVASSITVEAQDKLQFDAKSYAAEAGCVDVTYTNSGSLAHTLLIKGKTGFKLSVGDKDTGQITLDKGTYTLYCDIAGHQSAGMEATLTVS